MTMTENSAHESGYSFGKARGSWVIDGNTDPKYAQRILDGYNEGDPEIMDMMPAPLNGEWAGASIPELIEEFDCNLWDSEVADQFESGYAKGYWEAILAVAVNVTEDVTVDVEVPLDVQRFIVAMVEYVTDTPVEYEGGEQRFFAMLCKGVELYAEALGEHPALAVQSIEENVAP